MMTFSAVSPECRWTRKATLSREERSWWRFAPSCRTTPSTEPSLPWSGAPTTRSCSCVATRRLRTSGPVISPVGWSTSSQPNFHQIQKSLSSVSLRSLLVLSTPMNLLLLSEEPTLVTWSSGTLGRRNSLFRSPRTKLTIT